MCTIGALLRGGRCLLIKSFDYPPTPTGWARFTPFDGGHEHFALVDHDQQGLNSGINAAGLALLISRSKCEGPSSEKEELRTILNADVLTRFSEVGPAVGHIEKFAREHPAMFGGNVILADGRSISATEYFGGRVKSEIRQDGYLVRANHSMFGVVDNQDREDSQVRHRIMDEFLKGIEPEGFFDRGRELLETPPILNDKTRSAFLIDVQERKVVYRVGEGAWATFSFESTQASTPL